MAEALDLLAGLGLQHLDVKPANLFLVGGHAKIGDFGLVAPVAPRADGEGDWGGATPRYTPPEVFDGVVAATSDQYSLGLTAYELLTGSFPYPSGSAGQALAMHVSGRPNLSAVGPDAARVFARALAKRPGDRFPSCREFVRRLAECVADPLSRTPPPARELDATWARPESDGGTGRAGGPATAFTRRTPPGGGAAVGGVTPAVVFDAAGRADPGTPAPEAGKVVRAVIRTSLLAATGVDPADATGKTDVARLFLRFPVRCGPAELSGRLASFAAAHGLSAATTEGGTEVVLVAAKPGGWLGRLLDTGPPVELVVTLPPASGSGEAMVLARGCGDAAGRVDRRRYALALGLLRRVREALAEGEDRRKFTRYPVTAPVLLYPIGPDGALLPGVEGRSLDLSEGGGAVEIAQTLGADRLYLRFPGHPTAPHVGVLCAVVRRTEAVNGTVLGYEFRNG